MTPLRVPHPLKKKKKRWCWVRGTQKRKEKKVERGPRLPRGGVQCPDLNTAVRGVPRPDVRATLVAKTFHTEKR